MYKTCLQILKAHFHAKSKEEATPIDFCEQVRILGKNHCKSLVRCTKQDAWRTVEARCTGSEHAVLFYMGAAHWGGTAHWVCCAAHIVKGPKTVNLCSKSPRTCTDLTGRAFISVIYQSLCYGMMINEWKWLKK